MKDYYYLLKMKSMIPKKEYSQKARKGIVIIIRKLNF